MLYYDCYFLIPLYMPLEKQPEDASGKPGLPVVGEVKSSVDAVLSGEKPKNWSPEFRDFMVHYVGPETEELTVGKKMIVMTQNSQYDCVVTDNGLKVTTVSKIQDMEFDSFNDSYCLAQTK
jgi:hypothetical protein